MRWLRAVRALARVEWRQARTHRRRSLLLVILIAVPVAAVVGAATLARITSATSEERTRQAMGAAALRVELGSGVDALERFVRLLPGGPSTATQIFAGQETLRVPGQELHAASIATPAGALELSGAAAGMLALMNGRWPARADEVALSSVMLEGLQKAIGDTVTVGGRHRCVITGVAAAAEDVRTPLVVRILDGPESHGRRFVLVQSSPAEAAGLVERLRSAGLSVRTRAEAAEITGGLASLAFTAGAIGFLEAALVIAAAFAVSLRRRQYEIGLLESAGAAPPEITAAMLLCAVALAACGGVVGVVMGVGAAWALHPHLDAWNGRLNGAFEVAPKDVGAAFVLGLLTALLAAGVTVRKALQVPLREALGACRPAPVRAHTGLTVGIACMVAGVVLMVVPLPRTEMPALILLVGRPILIILGLGLCSPSLLGGLGHMAARLPLAWRLAVRDAGRFRSRNGPVVTAVLVGMSLTVTAAVIVSTVQAKLDALPRTLRDDQVLVSGTRAGDVARRVGTEFGGVAVAPLQMVCSNSEPVRARFTAGETRRFTRDWVACGDQELLRALGADAGANALRLGKLIVLDPPARDATVELSAPGIPTISNLSTTGVSLDQKVSAPLFVMPVDALAALGMLPGPPPGHHVVPYLVRLSRPLTRDTLHRARELAAQVPGTTVDAALLHSHPTRTIYFVAWVVCTLTSLIVVLVATSLSGAESAADERVLHTVGAAPALLRRHAATRAGYIAFLGCALAIPAGLFTALALLKAANFDLELVWPWGDLVFLMLLLPAMAYGCAWLSHRLSATREIVALR